MPTTVPQTLSSRGTRGLFGIAERKVYYRAKNFITLAVASMSRSLVPRDDNKILAMCTAKLLKQAGIRLFARF